MKGKRMVIPSGKNNETIVRTAVLLALGILYLGLVASAFVFAVDLASSKVMQYALHITVVLSAFAYLFFADSVNSVEGDNENGRLVLIFAALFTVPILIGRGIGLAAISFDTLYSNDSIFNFYASVSVSRTIELVAWTTFFPLSMVFLARIFFRQGKGADVLAWLCSLSATCCFAASITIVSPNLIFLFIGVFGWGFLFIAVITAYLIRQMRKKYR